MPVRKQSKSIGTRGSRSAASSLVMMVPARSRMSWSCSATNPSKTGRCCASTLELSVCTAYSA
eukprot:scaffold108452_cov34-Tisochrysis_lutea.AAC.1